MVNSDFVNTEIGLSPQKQLRINEFSCTARLIGVLIGPISQLVMSNPNFAMILILFHGRARLRMTRTCCFGNLYKEDNRLQETIPSLIESLNTLCMIWEDYIAIHKTAFQFKLVDYDFLSISTQ